MNTNPTDEIEREVGDALDTFCDSRADEHWHVSSRALDDLTVWFTAYIAKREAGLRAYAVKLDDWNDKLQAETDALRAEVEKLRAVERAARAFVLAHDSIVVRFQDATLAQVYEDRARELDALLDARREEAP